MKQRRPIGKSVRLDPITAEITEQVARKRDMTEGEVIDEAILKVFGKEAYIKLPADLRDRVAGLSALGKLREWLRQRVGEEKKKGALPPSITGDLAAEIASNEDGMRGTWETACEHLGERIVNTRIGRTTREASGMRAHEQVRATGPAADIIRTYTALRP